MDVKTLCLGMLSFGDACGYDLKKRFEALFRHFYAAGYGSIYPALAELAEAGLVTCRAVPQERRPDRKVYRITEAGRQQFLDALHTTRPQHKLRSEFLAMIYFAELMDAERLDALLDDRLRHLRDAQAHIADIQRAWNEQVPGRGALRGRIRRGAGQGRRGLYRGEPPHVDARWRFADPEHPCRANRRRRPVGADDQRDWNPGMSIASKLYSRPWLMAGLVAGAVILWLASGSLGGRKSGGSEPAASAQRASTAATRVQVRTQQAEPIMRFISVFGRTAPARIVDIKAETNGRVEALVVDRGQQVRKGTVMVRLDLRDRQARLEQSQASVAQFQTAYEAQLELKTKGYVSDTQLAETLAKLEGARADLVRAELDLDYRLIRAPFDGVIQERPVELGDFVRAGDPVLTFVDNTRLIVTASIAEQDAKHVVGEQRGARQAGHRAAGQGADPFHRAGR